MKKYFTTVIALSVVIALIGSCQSRNNKDKSSSEPIINTSSQDDQDSNANNSYDDSSSIDSSYRDSNTLSNEDFSIMVNEEVYQNLLIAKSNFESLLQNGSVSFQMKNYGTNLTSDESNYIDSAMSATYDLICQYINYYGVDNNACYEVGTLLYGSYYHGLSRDYLYHLLVAKNLPEEYQCNFKYDDNCNIYDENGNIVLINGNRIHLIGPSDELVCSNKKEDDAYNDMVICSEWYQNLPSILMDQYSVIHHTGNEDGVCYLWNESKIEETCDREWSRIKEEGQSTYGFDSYQTKITWVSDANSYVFESQDEDIYGPLTYDENISIDKIYAVQDALVYDSGDVYQLDGFIQDMAYSQGAQYYK